MIEVKYSLDTAKSEMMKLLVQSEINARVFFCGVDTLFSRKPNILPCTNFAHIMSNRDFHRFLFVE